MLLGFRTVICIELRERCGTSMLALRVFGAGLYFIQGVRHVVVKGETLKLIAYNHGTNLDHMRVLNPGIDINYLLPGQARFRSVNSACTQMHSVQRHARSLLT